jgi:hypothetical protein
VSRAFQMPPRDCRNVAEGAASYQAEFPELCRQKWVEDQKRFVEWDLGAGATQEDFSRSRCNAIGEQRTGRMRDILEGDGSDVDRPAADGWRERKGLAEWTKGSEISSFSALKHSPGVTSKQTRKLSLCSSRMRCQHTPFSFYCIYLFCFCALTIVTTTRKTRLQGDDGIVFGPLILCTRTFLWGVLYGR